MSHHGTATSSRLNSKVCKLQLLSLDEKWRKLEETIQRVATNTIGYTKKQANKEWFDEECAKVNEEKNAVRESEPFKSKPGEPRMLTN
jgi:hypothetical protein